MAANRFIHFISLTTLASGLLYAAVPARAEGGAADRASQESAGMPAPIESDAPRAQDNVARLQPVAPLPPRRPKDLEAAFAASQPEAPEGAAPAPVAVAQPEAHPQQFAAIARTDPPPAPLAQPAPPPAMDAQPSAASVSSPLPPQPVPASRPAGTGGLGMTALSAWPTVVESGQFQNAKRGWSADLPAEAPAEAVVDVNKAVKGPMPPERPALASDASSPAAPPAALAAATPPAAGMALGSITVVQPQPAAQAAGTAKTPLAAEPEPMAVAVPLPPIRPRLLAPPIITANAALRTETDAEETQSLQKIGYVPPPRGKSRLNHIIGDNAEAANSLRSLISKHATANGIPYRLADAVVRVESRYNPMARNGPYMGLMQIHPRTAASLGYGGDARGLLEADTNLQYGIKYLAMAYRLAGGDTCGTIMRYQGGHRSVTMTAANRTYCNKVKMILAENHN